MGVILTIAAQYNTVYVEGHRPRIRGPDDNKEYSNSSTSFSSKNVNHTKLLRRMPGALIIGAKKAGTRAMLSTLNHHPQIVAAENEVQFFSWRYSKGTEWYLNQMPLTTIDQLAIEKSPSYFDYPSTPGRIAQDLKTVKLILLVRNPLERTISDYLELDSYHALHRLPRPKFEQVIYKHGNFNLASKTIYVSMYDDHFKRWLEVFPRDQIFIIDSSDFVANPFQEIVKVEKFLNIESFFKEEMFVFNTTKGFYCWRRPGQADLCQGSDKGRPHPDISPVDKRKLFDFFQPHTETFCSLANVNFTWCTLSEF